jgi:hypothetical protein
VYEEEQLEQEAVMPKPGQKLKQQGPVAQEFLPLDPAHPEIGYLKQLAGALESSCKPTPEVQCMISLTNTCIAAERFTRDDCRALERSFALVRAQAQVDDDCKEKDLPAVAAQMGQLHLLVFGGPGVRKVVAAGSAIGAAVAAHQPLSKALDTDGCSVFFDPSALAEVKQVNQHLAGSLKDALAGVMCLRTEVESLASAAAARESLKNLRNSQQQIENSCSLLLSLFHLWIDSAACGAIELGQALDRVILSVGDARALIDEINLDAPRGRLKEIGDRMVKTADEVQEMLESRPVFAASSTFQDRLRDIRMHAGELAGAAYETHMSSAQSREYQRHLDEIRKSVCTILSELNENLVGAYDLALIKTKMLALSTGGFEFHQGLHTLTRAPQHQHAVEPHRFELHPKWHIKVTEPESGQLVAHLDADPDGYVHYTPQAAQPYVYEAFDEAGIAVERITI